MTLQDLTNNRDRVIAKIRYQITMATGENVKAVFEKMVAMLPQFATEKPTKANVDKLTMKAIASYLKYNHSATQVQKDAIQAAVELKRQESMQSSLKAW